jgi:DNA primase small subunit
MDDAVAIPSQIEGHPETEGDVDMTQSQNDSETQGRDGTEKKEVKLDELFADVDSDDDFPSSAPVPKQEAASSPPPASLPT